MIKYIKVMQVHSKNLDKHKTCDYKIEKSFTGSGRKITITFVLLQLPILSPMN